MQSTSTTLHKTVKFIAVHQFLTPILNWCLFLTSVTTTETNRVTKTQNWFKLCKSTGAHLFQNQGTLFFQHCIWCKITPVKKNMMLEVEKKLHNTRNTHLSEMPHYYSPCSPLQRPQFTGSECQTGISETGFSQLVSPKCELPPTSRGRAYFPLPQALYPTLPLTARCQCYQLNNQTEQAVDSSWKSTLLRHHYFRAGSAPWPRDHAKAQTRMRCKYWDKHFRRILCFNELRPALILHYQVLPKLFACSSSEEYLFYTKITSFKTILLKHFHPIHVNFQSNLGLWFKYNKTKTQHLLFFTGN